MITDNSLTQPTRKPYESTATDDCIPSIRKETRARVLILRSMISESKDHRVQATHPEILFRFCGSLYSAIRTRGVGRHLPNEQYLARNGCERNMVTDRE